MSKVKDPALVAAIDFKSRIFYESGKSIMDTDTFKKLMLVPSILSTVLAIVVYLALLEAFAFFVYSNIESNAVAVALGVGYGIMLFFITKYTGILAFAQLTRYRMWHWGKTKFNSLEEYAEWVGKSDPRELDFAAGLPNEAWEPDDELGGIEIVQGYEKYLNKYVIAKSF